MSDPTGPTDPTRPMPAVPQQPVDQTAPQQPVDQAAPQPPVDQAAPQPPAPPKRPTLWRQATSTTGGTIAVAVAGALIALLVVGILGVGAMAVVRTVAGHDDRGGRMEQVRGGRDGKLPPGLQRRMDDGQLPGNGNGTGNGNGKAKGKAKGGQDGDGPRAGAPGGRGGLGGLGGLGRSGMGAMMGSAGALGDVQHGELTVQDQAGKAVVMTLQRGTVTTVSSTSVTVKSADGFTATYAVDDATRGRAGAVTKGDAVLVVAQKTGAKAVAIRAVRST